MLPWIVAAAAQLLSDNAKRARQQADLYGATLDRNAQRMGGGEYLMGDLYRTQRDIDDQSTNYGALLQLVGSELGGDDDDDKLTKSVQPRSGVKLRRSDF